MSQKELRRQPAALAARTRLGVAAVAACFIAAPVQSNPVNPVVVSGTASFNQAGQVLTVTNSNGAIINWDKFSIKAGETTHFAQTAASSTVLNRVLNDPTAIYGTLSSNGKVWLVNPAGIMVGPGGRIDTAGFVASTLNISNENFLAGRKLFDNTPGAGNVINQGEIRTPAGGSVYLIGSNVANESIISTPQGETILAAGATVSLVDSATPGVKVDITGAAGNATNLGQITAEAGRIGIAGVVVRNSGQVNASSVVSDGGRVFLQATRRAELAPTSVVRADAGGVGDGGNVLVWSDEVAEVDGVITARGAVGGSGGFVETSGRNQLRVGGLRVDTGGGRWLLDPNDFTIAAAGGDITGSDLSANLANNSVAILSSSGATPGNGDIFVNDAVTWGSGHSLELYAYRNIYINQPIDGGVSGGVALRPDQFGNDTGTVIFGGVGHVTAFNTTIHYNPPSYATPTDFSPNVTGSRDVMMLVNSLGNEGDEIAGTRGLQAIATNLGGRYVLGVPLIDASPTATWNSGAGFAPIGSPVTPFTGEFHGFGRAISGLTINRPTTDHVGLFGQVDAPGNVHSLNVFAASVAGREHVGAVVGLLNLGSVIGVQANGSVTGNGYDVGGVVGFNQGGYIANVNFNGTVSGGASGRRTGGLVGANWGQIHASSSLATVNGVHEVGGLVGGGDGIIDASEASGAVIGTGDDVGGLVGHAWGGSISNSQASSSVDGDGMHTGGLVGYNEGTIMASAAMGNVVNSNVSYSYAGGLVGNNEGLIQLSFAMGSVTGNHGVGGLVGLNSSLGGSIETSYASGAVSGGFDVGGLVGENRGPVTDAYAVGAVIGTDRAGGLTGWNSSTINTSYATGAVSSPGANTGGLVGFSDSGIVNNSFWDTDTTGRLTSAGGTGVNTAAMQTAATFLAAGWSPLTWTIADGSYPGIIGTPGVPQACAGYDNCWTGAIDSLWATAGNWTAGHAPTGTESIKIDVAGSPTISVAGVNPSFGSLWLAENLDVDAAVTFVLGNLFTLTSGTATVNGNATMADFAQTGGTLAGSGNFTVTNSYLQSSGNVNGFLNMTITQASGPLNFSATQVGSAILNANAIVLGPVNAGGLTITTDSLQVAAPVSAGLMPLYPKTYSAIRLGSAAANTLSLLQSDLDNLDVGELQAFAPTLTVNNGPSTVTLANVDTLQIGSKVSIESPLALTQPGSILLLNADRIDINQPISAGAGGVLLGQNGNTASYLVGVGGKTYPASTVELSNAELNRIVTTGPVFIGDPYNAHSPGLGSLQIVGPIDLTGITTQLRLVGNNGVTQAPGATITVPQLAVDGYGSINLPEANQVNTFAAKSVSGGVTFVNAGPLTIGKVETLASPTNFATTGVTGNDVIVSTGGALTIDAAPAQTVSVFGNEVWLHFNGDLSLNAAAGSQAYVEAASPTTIHLDFANSPGVVRFNGVTAAAPTNGLAGPGTPNFIGFWDAAAAAVPGTNLLLSNTTFSFGGAPCPGFDNCWTGAVDSLWATAGNWSAGHAPTGSESAKVDVAGTPTIAILGINPSFGSLWLAENLNVDAGVSFTLSNLFTLNAGAATFDGAASVNGYAQTGGTLGGAGTFTVTNSFVQSGGVINRSGNLNITHSGNLTLGDITTSGVLNAVATGRISGSHVVRGGSVNLLSQTGGAFGGSAIDLDVEAGSALMATVNPGAAYGGIDLRSFSAIAPATISLTDGASGQPSIAFYHDGDLALGAGHTFNAGSGGIVIGAGGTLGGIQTARFGGAPAQLTLFADQDMSLSGALSLPATHVGLSAAGTLDIGHFLNAQHVSFSAATLNVGATVNASGDLNAGAGIINISGGISAQNVIVGAGELNVGVGGTGGIHAAGQLLAVVAGDANIIGGHLKTSGGDLELVVGQHLTIGDASHGGEIWAGYGQISEPFRDASIAVGGNLTLNNGAHINAANDVYIDMLGASSVLALNTGIGGPSYILSDIGTAMLGTAHLSFPARSSGGVLLDGVATTTTLIGGSGFFAVDLSTPATPGAGLEIAYGAAGSNSVDPCLLNPLLCKTPDTKPTTGDAPVVDPKNLPADLTAGGDTDTFGDESDKDEKDKKEQTEGKDGKKEEKSAQKRVAQCT